MTAEEGAPMGMVADVGDSQAKAERWNSKGNSYLAVKDYRTAISCFDMALKTLPGAPEQDVYLSNRATALFRTGDYLAAIEGFRQAIELRPTKHSHFTCLGKVFLRWGGHEAEAFAALSRSLELKPTSVAANLAAKAHAALERAGKVSGPLELNFSELDYSGPQASLSLVDDKFMMPRPMSAPALGTRSGLGFHNDVPTGTGRANQSAVDKTQPDVHDIRDGDQKTRVATLLVQSLLAEKNQSVNSCKVDGRDQQLECAHVEEPEIHEACAERAAREMAAPIRSSQNSSALVQGQADRQHDTSSRTGDGNDAKQETLSEADTNTQTERTDSATPNSEGSANGWGLDTFMSRWKVFSNNPEDGGVVTVDGNRGKRPERDGSADESDTNDMPVTERMARFFSQPSRSASVRASASKNGAPGHAREDREDRKDRSSSRSGPIVYRRHGHQASTTGKDSRHSEMRPAGAVETSANIGECSAVDLQTYDDSDIADALAVVGRAAESLAIEESLATGYEDKDERGVREGQNSPSRQYQGRPRGMYHTPEPSPPKGLPNGPRHDIAQATAAAAQKLAWGRGNTCNVNVDINDDNDAPPGLGPLEAVRRQHSSYKGASKSTYRRTGGEHNDARLDAPPPYREKLDHPVLPDFRERGASAQVPLSLSPADKSYGLNGGHEGGAESAPEQQALLDLSHMNGDGSFPTRVDEDMVCGRNAQTPVPSTEPSGGPATSDDEIWANDSEMACMSPSRDGFHEEHKVGEDGRDSQLGEVVHEEASNSVNDMVRCQREGGDLFGVSNDTLERCVKERWLAETAASARVAATLGVSESSSFASSDRTCESYSDRDLTCAEGEHGPGGRIRRLRWPGRTRGVAIATCLESPKDTGGESRTSPFGHRRRASDEALRGEAGRHNRRYGSMLLPEERVFFSTSSSPPEMLHMSDVARARMPKRSSSYTANANGSRGWIGAATALSGRRRLRRWVNGRRSGDLSDDIPSPSEEAVRQWIHEVLGSDTLKRETGMTENLKDGRILVRLAKAVGGARVQGHEKDIEASTPLLQLVNVHNYMAIARSIGVPEDGLFYPKDLVDAPANGPCPPCVLRSLAALSKAAQSHHSTEKAGDHYTGLLLGEEKRRRFRPPGHLPSRVHEQTGLEARQDEIATPSESAKSAQDEEG